MKSYTIVPVFVAAATAQINGDFGPNCGIENLAITDLLPQVQPIAQALTDINGTTFDLREAIGAFVGTDIGTVVDLQGASTNLLNTIDAADTSVAALTPLTNSDEDTAAALDLPRFVTSLACNVNRTVADLISRKQDFVDACVGPLVLQSATDQQEESEAFTQTTLSKLPSGLLEEAGRQVQPIRDALSSAVSAFADQTTQPASCGGSTATDTSVPPTATDTSVPPTDTSVPPTGGNPYPTQPYPTGSEPYPTQQPPYPTGGDDECDDEPEPTGAYPTDDDCDEEPTGSYPPSGYPTGGQPSYPTTTKSYGTWEPVPYPSESSSYFPGKPSSQPTYEPHPTSQPTYEPHPTSQPTYEPHPTSQPTYEPHPTSQPTYEPHPTSQQPGTYQPPTTQLPGTYQPSTTTPAPIVTSSYTPPAYTGAAVANAANGFGAVAFMAAVVAVL